MKPEILITGPMYPPTLAELEQTYAAHRLWSAPDKDALLASLATRSPRSRAPTSGGITAPPWRSCRN
jgi:hypothetical protein